MAQYTKTITFDAKDDLQAQAVANSINTILRTIEDKKHLIELGEIVGKKPGLIKKGIPYLKLL